MTSHGFRVKPTLSRLNKEIGLLNDNHYNCNVLFNNNYINIYIAIVAQHRTNIMVTIEIDKYYPFKPPTIYINNVKYYNILKMISIRYNCNETCLCCKSITCPDKWKPSCKIQDILNEILLYQNNIISFLPVGVYD